MKQNVFVAGGAGYIGSHMVRQLLDAGFQPVVFDNLSTGHRELVPNEAIFIQGDLQNPDDIARVFREFKFDGVMHFAASSIVPESVKNPLKYYRNNTAAFLNLMDVVVSASPDMKIIFSSTAAVYGEPDEVPILENSAAKPLNPYGQSKLMIEKILADTAVTYPLSYVVFRYFNVAGAHEHAETGEWHEPETHLIPNLIAAVQNDKEFNLFGENYPTPDGTCVRDYIHVEDLCKAHLLALKYLLRGGKTETFNLGSSAGYSVRKMMAAVEKVTGINVQLKKGPRRPGDPAVLVADSSKADRVLGWTVTKTLEDIIRTAYQWSEKNKPAHGYAAGKTA